MKKNQLFIVLFLFGNLISIAQTVTDVKFEQVGKKLVITYNLDAPAGSQWQILVNASTDNGNTWGSNLSSVTGAVGRGIKPGKYKKITWDVLAERAALTGNVSLKIKAEGNVSGDIEMVFLQGGTFTMGSNNGDDDEKPLHSVTLSDFYIGKTEVTQKQWRDVMGNKPSYFKNCDNCPVEQVSWNDIQDFLQKLNQKTGKSYRLPTEAEWEYAARGGNKNKGYTYSGGNSPGKVAWFTDNSASKTRPVAQLQPNESGVYDMSGNVWEWCSDRYGDYSSNVQTNPKGPVKGSFRVYRGGGWNYEARYCRMANRDNGNPDGRSGFIGFRLASSR